MLPENGSHFFCYVFGSQSTTLLSSLVCPREPLWGLSWVSPSFWLLNIRKKGWAFVRSFVSKLSLLPLVLLRLLSFLTRSHKTARYIMKVCAAPCFITGWTASFSLELCFLIKIKKKTDLFHTSQTPSTSSTSLKHPPFSPLYRPLQPPFLVSKLAWLWTGRRKMKVTGGYHGTMRHRTHAEGFHALSAPHISTSALHMQDHPPPHTHFNRQNIQENPSIPHYRHPTFPTQTLTGSLIIKPQLSKTCPQCSQRQNGLLLMNIQ